MRVRSATRSSRWSTSSRTWREGPSSCAAGRSGSRRVVDRERVEGVGLAGLAGAAANAGLWGAQTRSGSRGRAVFVNEPTETIPSADAERMGRIN
jgi:hypothetical protein